MSSYYVKARNPKTGKWETAFAQDDYFGPHKYGILFVDNKKAYKREEIECGDIRKEPEEKTPRKNISDFLRNASKEETEELLSEVTEKANSDQRAVMEEAEDETEYETEYGTLVITRTEGDFTKELDIIQACIWARVQQELNREGVHYSLGTAYRVGASIKYELHPRVLDLLSLQIKAAREEIVEKIEKKLDDAISIIKK